MNRRGARLVGETATVVQAIEHGSGRVKLGDSEWIAHGPNVAAGERVRVQRQRRRDPAGRTAALLRGRAGAAGTRLPTALSLR
jgi:hypothetical protein